jgi:hypothetical protein
MSNNKESVNMKEQIVITLAKAAGCDLQLQTHGGSEYCDTNCGEYRSEETRAILFLEVCEKYSLDIVQATQHEITHYLQHMNGTTNELGVLEFGVLGLAIPHYVDVRLASVEKDYPEMFEIYYKDSQIEKEAFTVEAWSFEEAVEFFTLWGEAINLKQESAQFHAYDMISDAEMEIRMTKYSHLVAKAEWVATRATQKASRNFFGC